MSNFGRLILALLTVWAMSTQAQEQSSPVGDWDLVVQVCARCHCVEQYVTPRSHKAWELTVSNMRMYTSGKYGEFSENDAGRIVNYLDKYFGETSTNDARVFFSAPPPEPVPVLAIPAAPKPAPPVPAVPEVAVAPTTTWISATSATSAPRTAFVKTAVAKPFKALAALPAKVRLKVPDSIRRRLEQPIRTLPPVVKHCAVAGGRLAVICVLALLVTGHLRRRLGKWFRPIHVMAALGLFVGLAVHGVIYLVQYGNPPVLWYWFGVVSFLILVLAQVQGLIRKRFGRIFLRVHVTAGYAGFALAILHWIWA